MLCKKIAVILLSAYETAAAKFAAVQGIRPAAVLDKMPAGLFCFPAMLKCIRELHPAAVPGNLFPDSSFFLKFFEGE